MPTPDPDEPFSSDASASDASDNNSAEGRAGFVSEFVKKMAVAGLGAIFMTEEGLRNLAGQLKVPKEMLGLVMSQAERTKDEIGRVLSDEVRRFLQSEKLRQESLRLLTGMTVEISAQIRLKPLEEGQEGDPVPVLDKVVVTTQKSKRSRDNR